MKSKIRTWWRRYGWESLSLLVLAGLLILGATHHEQWRDEAQQWLLVRDCTFHDLWQMLAYEGHFLLWYLLIWPLAHAGFSLASVNFLSAFLVWLAAALIVFKSPFVRWKRCAFIFCLPMLYWYPVVARCYALIPLAIAAMALTHRQRWQRPWAYLLSVWFLANTHVIMLGLVGMCLLVFLLENIQAWPQIKPRSRQILVYSWIMTGVLLLLTAWPLMGSLHKNQMVGNGATDLKSAVVKLNYLPLQLLGDNFYLWWQWRWSIYLLLCVVVWHLIVDICAYPRDYLQIIPAVGWQLWIYVALWGQIPQRSISVIFIWLFFHWLRREKPLPKMLSVDWKLQKSSLVILLIASITTGMYWWWREWKGNYSQAGKIAAYIQEKIPSDGAVIVMGNRPEFGSAVAGFLPASYRFYYLPTHEDFSYTVWDESALDSVTETSFLQELQQVFPDKKWYYLYAAEKISPTDDSELVATLEANGALKWLTGCDAGFGAREMIWLFEIVPEEATNLSLDIGTETT